jgi:hypothetical protein
MFLYAQLGFCFKPHSRLALVIKWTIEATVVEIHSHSGILLRIVQRILAARIKKISRMPQIMRSVGTPNAGHQARRAAEARDERTLYAVACMPLILIEAPSQPTTVVG